MSRMSPRTPTPGAGNENWDRGFQWHREGRRGPPTPREGQCLCQYVRSFNEVSAAVPDLELREKDSLEDGSGSSPSAGLTSGGLTSESMAPSTSAAQRSSWEAPREWQSSQEHYDHRRGHLYSIEERGHQTMPIERIRPPMTAKLSGGQTYHGVSWDNPLPFRRIAADKYCWQHELCYR